MRHKIYFSDLTHMGLGISARTFPLGIGTVAAYVVEQFGDRIAPIMFKLPDELNRALATEAPRVACFTHYVWNAQLVYRFAEYAKRRNPETVTVLGGPNFPLDPADRRRFLEAHPYVDFYIKWDGEHAFARLFDELEKTDFDVRTLKAKRSSLPNWCYLDGDHYVEGPDERVMALAQLPSPYLLGLFDPFFAQPFDVLFETTRGCPYACTFCNDGHATRSKINRKTSERIRDELEYIASRVVLPVEMHLADLNYGMYREDLDTSRMIRSIIDRHGWPSRVITSVGKSHPERVLEAADIINGDGQGIFKFGASFQSTDAVVLRNIKRKNVPLDKLSQLRDLKSDPTLEYFTELIVPLPGDTLDTHYASLRDCIDRLGMNNIDVHQLTLLPGTEMALAESRVRYGLDVRHRVYVGCLGLYQIGEEEVPCAEIEEVVVATNTMPFDNYLDCRIMDLLVKVYIDHDLFSEIFGFIRRKGLSEFALLRRVKDQAIARYPDLVVLIRDFLAGTEKPFFESAEAIKTFVSRRDVIESFIVGELGQNEILAHRSRAYLECNESLHGALKDAALAYLDDEGLLNTQVAQFIEQAATFSKLSKFAMHDVQEVREAEFTFDFIAARARKFAVEPTDIRMAPRRIRFVHDERSRQLIDEKIALWSQGPSFNYGKFYQKSNLRLMARTAEFV